jgi:hypothetical protein
MLTESAVFDVVATVLVLDASGTSVEGGRPSASPLLQAIAQAS